MGGSSGSVCQAARPFDGFAGWQLEAGGSGQLDAFQHFGTQLQTAGIVHVQDLDGSTPDRANADDAYAFESEVVGPSITPRMKDGRQFPSLRVDSGHYVPGANGNIRNDRQLAAGQGPA
jgi:hypothetical protein